MDYSNILDVGDSLNIGGRLNLGLGGVIFIIGLAVWEVVWKGLGLWKAAQNKQTGWFVAMLAINSVGILPILYLYVFSPKQPNSK